MHNAKAGERCEIDQHDRPEPCANLGRAARLERKQSADNHNRYGQDPGAKTLADIFQTFRRRQDRHSRRNHGVAIEKGGRKNAKHHERRCPFCTCSLPVNQREKGKASALALVVGFHDREDIFECHNDHHRPKNET